MEAFISRKRRRISPEAVARPTPPTSRQDPSFDDDSTDVRLAMLASLHSGFSHEMLLDALLAADGSVEGASQALSGTDLDVSPRKRRIALGYQSSLAKFATLGSGKSEDGATSRPLTQKGKTLYLYAPEDVEKNTPCSIIHNFLPALEADVLLRELLEEAPAFQKETFQLFDRTVESPHTMCFYVDSLAEAEEQQTEYVYNGSYIADVHQTLPEMLKVSQKVKHTVNLEIQRRIRDIYPDGKKLKYQSPHEWTPNASFVNCYDGPRESVGYHSDQLTYLGPRAVIGSLSLGVAREFRVRRSVPPDASSADVQGQISIHLPHNSLLIMHAEMQEEWKHAVAPAKAIDPHPVAGNKRLNITYRCYKESLHPKYTPRCKCNVPAVLRCVQKRSVTKGKYMWMCHSGYTPGQKGCSYFAWAEFDDEGEPPWADKVLQDGKADPR